MQVRADEFKPVSTAADMLHLSRAETAPEVAPLSVDFHEDRVQVPPPAAKTEALHPTRITEVNIGQHLAIRTERARGSHRRRARAANPPRSAGKTEIGHTA